MGIGIQTAFSNSIRDAEHQITKKITFNISHYEVACCTRLVKKQEILEVFCGCISWLLFIFDRSLPLKENERFFYVPLSQFQSATNPF